MLDTVRHCSFSARLDCHYLVQAPADMAGGEALVVALHGYGQNAQMMLPLVRKLVGPQPIVASIEAPHAFFLTPKADDVGFSWVTGRHAAEGIRLHHDMVLQVLSEVGREFGVPRERRILMGFSQPVSLNYRFAATCTEAVRGVIGVCGGLPSDWESGNYRPVKASVLHIARREDEWYPASATEQYAARLRLRVEDVEFHMLEGGHRIPSQAHPIVGNWSGRILR